ncbi:TadE family protein [Microbacterium sp. NIBRBAC000506063]|uniref:TadE family protein n=1 Tax=Microbacterium sp. NIBRBAC000506063 TaxID=2734618 RepID=UPI001BB70107|nr:TadE family protein [Microbacterium sp. NIBRBAC000506063]QTV79790.1 TadE family protein [Microbacterium sp. NIBRBAC000506063]
MTERMMSESARDERGSAPLEFIGVGLILLVPLVYLVIALGAIQQQTLGAEAAARHTARAISQASDAASATARADAVLAAVVREYRMPPDAVGVALACTPAGSVCPAAGATVHVTVTTRVALPFVPALFGLNELATIPIEAAAVQKISRVWSDG